jgi:mannosyltransferase
MRALGLDPAVRYAGCVGRVRHQKGTDLFVDTMIALLPEFPGWSAIIAGRATAEHKGFEDGLRRRVAAAGLGDRILFVGEHADIPPWYRALSLLVAPQRWEGFGLTPLEAMASGVPVVAADVGAFSELVVEGSTGTIIPPGNLEAMVGAVRPYMADETMRSARAAAALGHVRRNHPLQREADDIIAVYERLWAGEGKGR